MPKEIKAPTTTQMAFSVQQTANYAKLLGICIAMLGYEVSEESLITFVGVLMTLGAIAVSFYDRYTKGDVTIVGKRK